MFFVVQQDICQPSGPQISELPSSSPLLIHCVQLSACVLVRGVLSNSEIM